MQEVQGDGRNERILAGRLETAADSPAESGAILTEPSGLSLSNAGQQLLIGRPGFSFGCFG